MVATLNRVIAKRDALNKDDKGFTLIELLVVVLIIGILTAIAVPVFIGQQDQAKDAATKSDLGVAKVALVSYYTNDPDAAAPDAGDLATYGYQQSAEAGLVQVVSSTSATAFCLSATTVDTSKTFYISAAGGVTETACS